MNLNYYEARGLSATRHSFLEKRKIFELLDVKNNIRSRTTSGGYETIFTVYRNNLSMEEFKELLLHIKAHLIENDFKVERVNLESKSIYIFNINWRE